MIVQHITVRPVAQVDRQAFVQALNDAYSDYYVPIHLTAQSFESLATREGVDLEASAAALVGNRIVGMGLLAIRDSRGWIGGMGVIPAFRRRKIARQVMEYLIDQARRRSLTGIQLEVITQNIHAYHLYQTCGFETLRELLVLSYIPRGTSTQSRITASDYVIEPEQAVNLFERIADFSSVRRPWQRERAVLETLTDRLRALVIRSRSKGRLAGLCIYVNNGNSKNLLDFVANTPESGSALLTALLERTHPSSFSYLNVDAGDPLLPVLIDAGFTETLRQFEMFLPLGQGQEIPGG